MRIRCHHCEHNAIIKTTSPVTKTFTTLYITCPHCLAHWVMNIEVSHEIPTPTHTEFLAQSIAKLPPDQKAILKSNQSHKST